MNITALRAARREARLGKTPTAGYPSYHELVVIRKHRFPRFAGPGSATEFILKERWGAHACGGCIKSRQKMDENGPQWCRDNLPELAQEMHENVEELRRTKKPKKEGEKSGWVAVAEWFAYETTGLHFHKQLINDGINLYETTCADAEKVKEADRKAKSVITVESITSNTPTKPPVKAIEHKPKEVDL